MRGRLFAHRTLGRDENGVFDDLRGGGGDDDIRDDDDVRVVVSRKEKDKDKDDAFQWLLTRQLEVEMSLRGSPPATQADVEATRATFASFVEFFDALRDGARALSDRAASGAGARSPRREPARR